MPSWRPEDLAHINLTRVYTSASPRFGPYYDDSRPLARLSPRHYRGQPRHSYREIALSGAAFFDSLQHVYYSGEIERDLDLPLRAQLAQLEQSLISLRPQRSSVNLWLGRRSTAAPCHYDGYHNAFSQLYGVKRFVLLPPRAARLLRPFPFLHPSHAQCQNVLPSLGIEDLTAAGALEVELVAGDVLYLPPLWFHEVVALSDSISINGWSDSDEAAAAADLFAIKRPTTAHDAGEGGAAVAAARLLAQLSIAIEGDATAVSRRVWQERYKELALHAKELTLDWDSMAAPPCMAIAKAFSQQGSSLTEGWTDEATAWLQAAARVAVERLPAGSRSLWVENLAELVAAEHVGVARVAPLLKAIVDCTATATIRPATLDSAR